jgi:hypothetical protein
MVVERLVKTHVERYLQALMFLKYPCRVGIYKCLIVIKDPCRKVLLKRLSLQKSEKHSGSIFENGHF